MKREDLYLAVLFVGSVVLLAVMWQLAVMS